jgi:PAS domain-containing protein
MIPVFVKAVEGQKPDLDALVKSDFLSCRLCKGTTEVTEEVAERYARGQAFANKRKRACYGPREYAEYRGILPSDLLRMEQGLMEPIQFVEPPVVMVNIPAVDVRDLMVARDHARQERDWLRLLFQAEAQGLVYENDEKTHKQVNNRMKIILGETGVPIYNEEIETRLIQLLKERTDARTEANTTTEGGTAKGFGPSPASR